MDYIEPPKPTITPEELRAKFDEYDKDKCGLITDTSAHQLLKDIGHTVYEPSVRKFCGMINQDIEANHFNFDQLNTYVNLLGNPPALSIWKAEKQIVMVKKEIKDGWFKRSEGKNFVSAAPGAPKSLELPKGGNMEGKLDIAVGKGQQKTSSYIQVNVEKQAKPKSKPFLKLHIKVKNHQQAKKAQQGIKKLQQNLASFLLQQEPVVGYILKQINLITSTDDSSLTVFVTTSSELINSYLDTLGSFWDTLADHQTQLRGFLRYAFNFDFNKFMTKPEYSFYDLFTRDCRLQLQWNLFQFINALKQGLFTTNYLNDLKYDIEQMGCMIATQCLYCQKVDLTLCFDNNNQDKPVELDSKKQIYQGVNWFKLQAVAEINEMAGIDVVELIRLLEKGQIKAEASFGEWKLQVDLKLPKLSTLLTEDWAEIE